MSLLGRDNVLPQPGNRFTSVDFIVVVVFNFFLMFISERERGSASGGGNRKRGRHRIRSRFQAPSCQHRAQHGTQTHEQRDYDLSRT